MRICYFLALDGMDVCLGRRKPLVPPRWLNLVGDGSFENVGDEFLHYFVDMGGLKPTARVLDIGCGIGRMARPLTTYLTTGSYEGFDVTPSGVDWCTKNITSRYPNFRFTLADIRNREYNPTGLVSASDYRFPYNDAQFDFAFLTSVFTHMLPSEVSNYLHELARVLVPGGNCLATFFFMNDEARCHIAAGKSSLNLDYSISGCWTTDLRIPETAIGYDEGRILQLLENSGFILLKRVYGKWCGREQYQSYQDILIFQKA
jgi:ubiquinone/menaquinone biosynthesis C-methylase UbiE